MNDTPCAGVAGFVHDPGRNRDETAVRLVVFSSRLALCLECPYRAECIDLVQPQQSRFDGICGGRLWINGNVVANPADLPDSELTEPKLRAYCGTDTGYRQHRTLGEPVCLSCASAVRLVERARQEHKDREAREEARALTAA